MFSCFLPMGCFIDRCLVHILDDIHNLLARKLIIVLLISGLICDYGLTLGDLIGVLEDFFSSLGAKTST